MISKLLNLQDKIYYHGINSNGDYYARYSPKVSFLKLANFTGWSFFGSVYDELEFSVDESENFAFCKFIQLIS